MGERREPDWTSQSLLSRVRRGEAEAWERLVEVYGPLVYGWCRASGLDEHDARDVGQEVFADVARRLPEYRWDRPGDSFRGLLRVITRFKVVDFLRARRERARGGTDNLRNVAAIVAASDASGPPDTAFPEEDDEHERRIVHSRLLNYLRGQIDERHWRVFERTVVDGQNATSVAEEFGMTPANVRQIKRRVLKRLRAELEALGERNPPLAGDDGENG